MKEINAPRIEELFHAGLELSTAERNAYWQRECGADSELLAALNNLHAGHEFILENDLLGQAAWSLNTEAILPSQHSELIGKKIGPYKIIGLLATGGMGEVYLANELTRKVVIKVLRDVRSQAARDYFMREMRVLAGLRHENIVQMFLGDFHEGDPFIAMEYFPGQSLLQYLQLPGGRDEQRALPVAQVLEIARQVCTGLGYAHRAHQVTHRDIKPSNILIREDADGLKVRVIDFGIALPPELETPDAITHRPSIGAAGTPVYMSPEQMENRIALKRVREIDHRSDVYSFALVIYEMLTGRLAFPTEAHRHYHEPVPACELRPELPKQVDEVLKKALHDNPASRHQSMQELFEHLKKVLTAQPPPPPIPIWSKALAAGAGAIVLALAAWLGYQKLHAAPVIVPPVVIIANTPQPTPELPNTKPPASALNLVKLSLFAQTNNNQSELASPDTVFRNSGRNQSTGGVRLAVEATSKGYVYLLEKNAQGQLAILHPHPKNPAGERVLNAGQQVFLPNATQWLRFNGAAGTDEVFVLFAPAKGDPLFAPLEDSIKRKKTVVETPDVDAFIASLARQASELTNPPGSSAEAKQRILQGVGPLVGILKLQHTK
jgi:serine/threonine protein kinase